MAPPVSELCAADLACPFLLMPPESLEEKLGTGGDVVSVSLIAVGSLSLIAHVAEAVRRAVEAEVAWWRECLGG